MSPELQPLSASTETLTPLAEDGYTEAYTNPALYPSASSFPSARTFPAEENVVDRTGMWMDTLSADAQILTPLMED